MKREIEKCSNVMERKVYTHHARATRQEHRDGENQRDSREGQGDGQSEVMERIKHNAGKRERCRIHKTECSREGKREEDRERMRWNAVITVLIFGHSKTTALAALYW